MEPDEEDKKEEEHEQMQEDEHNEEEYATQSLYSVCIKPSTSNSLVFKTCAHDAPGISIQRGKYQDHVWPSALKDSRVFSINGRLGDSFTAEEATRLLKVKQKLCPFRNHSV